MHKGMALLQHTMLIILVNLPEVVNQKHGQHNNDHYEHDSHDNDLVLLLDQERRQCNANIEWSCALRVAVFHAVLLLGLISQAFIGFGDHYESCVRFRIVLVAVRMILERKLTIRFFYLLDGGIGLNFKDLVGVKPFHGVALLLQDHETVHEPKYDGNSEDNLQWWGAYFDNEPAGNKLVLVFKFELGYLFGELRLILNLFELGDVAEGIEQRLEYVIEQGHRHDEQDGGEEMIRGSIIVLQVLGRAGATRERVSERHLIPQYNISHSYNRKNTWSLTIVPSPI